MSVGYVTGLLFAAISINIKSVECSIKMAEAGTSKSEKIMSVQGKLFGGIFDSIIQLAQGISPGTKWCGVGNVAEHDDDFGTSEQTDKCCKEHDHCDTFIVGGETKYGLKNEAISTISSCDCDQKLLDCMVDVACSEETSDDDKKTARTFGRLFFNIITTKCLVYRHPLVCVDNGTSETCSHYKTETNQPKVWEFIPSPEFPSYVN